MREKNEEELKATMASEKYRQREILREKNEEEFKAKRALEKSKERRRKQATCQNDLIRNFWAAVENGWSFPCVCCHKMRFDSQVVEFKEPLISQIRWQMIEKAIGDPNPKLMRGDTYYICHYCKNKLLKDQMPSISHKNSLELVDLEPYPELKLTPLENTLIAKNIVFQKIVTLPKSRWSGTKDKIVNVPIFEQDIVNTMERLPRTPDEAQLTCISLKRKLEYKNTHNTGYISVSRVEKALNTLYDLGHPEYQFVADMGGFEERCKENEPLLNFDRYSDVVFKKTPIESTPKKCKEEPKLYFKRFYRSLKEIPQWPFYFQFCIDPYSFYFWGCQLDTTATDDWPSESQVGKECKSMAVSAPFALVNAIKSRQFWQAEPKRIYDAALANGWKGAKLGKGFDWGGTVFTAAFPRTFEICSIPKPKNWYYKRTVHRNRAKKVGRRRASVGTLSKAMLGEVAQYTPDSWQMDKPWRHFSPTSQEK